VESRVDLVEVIYEFSNVEVCPSATHAAHPGRSSDGALSVEPRSAIWTVDPVLNNQPATTIATSTARPAPELQKSNN
jgi:hypothetical protein